MFTCIIPTISTTRIKNLSETSIGNRNEIIAIIDELRLSAKDAYASSMILIASAEIGDEVRFRLTLNQILEFLKDSSCLPACMQSNSFSAWMWGRIALAANSVNDAITTKLAQKNLQHLLSQQKSDHDGEAFYAWALAYKACINSQEYIFSKKRMLDSALVLSVSYQASGEQAHLSDALWAWLMCMQAAALAGDEQSYDWIKSQIIILTEDSSVALSLQRNLLRSTESNAYPAWALSIARYAAIIINDKALYDEIEPILLASIDDANQKNAKAEYALSFLTNQLAIAEAQSHHELKMILKN